MFCPVKGVDSFYQILKSVGKPKKVGTGMTENISGHATLLLEISFWPSRLQTEKRVKRWWWCQTTLCLAGPELPSGPSLGWVKFLCSTSSCSNQREMHSSEKWSSSRALAWWTVPNILSLILWRVDALGRKPPKRSLLLQGVRSPVVLGPS